MRRPQRAAAATLLAAVAAGCGGDSADDTAVAAVGEGASLEQFDIAGIAADPTGGGWLIEDVDGTKVVNHLDNEGAVEREAELPAWVRTDVLGLPDGRLAVAGLRCAEPSGDECHAAVMEISWVSADGGVSDPAMISTREASPEDVSLRIGGTADGLLWLSADGDLFAVGDGGTVEQRTEGVSHPCIVDDGVYVLSESGRPEMATPTADPDNPVTYSVSTLADGKVVPVEGGRFEGLSNSLGECIPSGFETYVSTKTESSRWTPTEGWFEVERALDPAAPRSTHAVGLQGDEFIVDDGGSLLVRNDAAAWEPTGITFESNRSKDMPPLVLFADRSGDAFVGCMSVEPDDPAQYGLECRAGGAR